MRTRTKKAEPKVEAMKTEPPKVESETNEKPAKAARSDPAAPSPEKNLVVFFGVDFAVERTDSLNWTAKQRRAIDTSHHLARSGGGHRWEVVGYFSSPGSSFRKIAARVEGRSSLGRLGLAVHVTAGFIDPGFEGQITLEIVNFNPYPIWLRPGMRIAQLVFAETKTEGSAYRGKYQGQEGTTESRAHVDFVTPTLPGLDVAPRAPTHAGERRSVDPGFRAYLDRLVAEGKARSFSFEVAPSQPAIEYTGPEPLTMQEAEEIAIAERAFRKLATRISTVEVESRLRAALDRFVGEQLTPQVRAMMQATTSNVLAEIVRETRIEFTDEELVALVRHAVRTR